MKRARNVEDLQLSLKNGRVVICSDVHIPFHDKKAVDAFLKYCKETQPEVVVLNGDILDMFMLSRFTKGEGRNPLAEIVLCRQFLKDIKKAVPEAKVYYVIGNHECRLEKYVLTKAPEVASIVEDVFTIIGTQRYGVFGCGSLTINKEFLIKHGTLLGNKSGLSAIKELENCYMSGASGHSHKLSLYIVRKAGRKLMWMETGGLMSMTPDYMIHPNWQQGFAIAEFKNGRLHKAEVLQIENGEIL